MTYRYWPTAGASIPLGALMITQTVERIEGTDFTLWNVYRFEMWTVKDGAKLHRGWRRVDRDPRVESGPWITGFSTLDEAIELMRYLASDPSAVALTG